jgi:hypothetical protein
MEVSTWLTTRSACTAKVRPGPRKPPATWTATASTTTSATPAIRSARDLGNAGDDARHAADDAEHDAKHGSDATLNW